MSIEYTDPTVVDGAHDLTPEERVLLEWAERLFDSTDESDPATRRNRWTDRWFRAQRWR